MAGPLSLTAPPPFIDAGPFGKIYVSGVVTGLGLYQDNPVLGDRRSQADLSNGQVIFQKTDGPLQFYLQVGAYSIPTIGTPYLNAGRTMDEFFGPVPQAYVKIAPNDSFSILVGKLPTLFGAESTFTFQNMNVQRGLLWNQENDVNRGVQVNYTTGPLAISVSLNDGFYSGNWSWLVGSLTYTINPENSVTVVAGGNLGRSARSTLATPLFQNNSSIYNLIYTYKSGPWTVTPYLQYTYVPANHAIGINGSASTYGAALLVNYAFTESFSLSARGEFIGSTGSLAQDTPNLLYGPGSKAWSVTLTPTFRYGPFFARADFAYIQALDAKPGFAFGTDGSKTSQGRMLLETGFVF